MNLLLIHVHEFFPFSCVAALHFPELSCTSPLSSLYRNLTSCLSMVQFQIRQFFFRHQGRRTMAMLVHGQRQLTNHITCSSDSLVNALFSNTHTHTHTQRRTCQRALSSSPISALKNHSSSFSLENLQPQKNLLKSLFICC